MSAIKIIGKLNPKQYSEMLDHLTRKKIKNPFIDAEDIVVNKKPEVEQTEMFNRFNVANPRQDMAGGGMLVQPGFDGTRQGYKKDNPGSVYKDGNGYSVRIGTSDNPNQVQGYFGAKKYGSLKKAKKAAETFRAKEAKNFEFLPGGPKTGKQAAAEKAIQELLDEGKEVTTAAVKEKLPKNLQKDFSGSKGYFSKAKKSFPNLDFKKSPRVFLKAPKEIAKVSKLIEDGLPLKEIQAKGFDVKFIKRVAKVNNLKIAETSYDYYKNVKKITNDLTKIGKNKKIAEAFENGTVSKDLIDKVGKVTKSNDPFYDSRLLFKLAEYYDGSLEEWYKPKLPAATKNQIANSDKVIKTSATFLGGKRNGYAYQNFLYDWGAKKIDKVLDLPLGTFRGIQRDIARTLPSGISLDEVFGVKSSGRFAPIEGILTNPLESGANVDKGSFVDNVKSNYQKQLVDASGNPKKQKEILKDYNDVVQKSKVRYPDVEFPNYKVGQPPNKTIKGFDRLPPLIQNRLLESYKTTGISPVTKKAVSIFDVAKATGSKTFGKLDESVQASLSNITSKQEKSILNNLQRLENSDQIRLARIGCPGKATGGRIGYFEGQNLIACATKGAEKIKNDPINLTGGDQQNLRALGKSVKAVRFLKNFLGPAAIAGELIFEGGFAANKFMSEGVPLKQALGESYINKFVLGPKTQIDVEAERAKEFAKGEDFAMAERGRRMAPFMAQSKEADAQRLKKREEERKALFPDLQFANPSNQEIDEILKEQGVFSPFTAGFGMQRTQPGIGDMRYNEDLAYNQIRDLINKKIDDRIQSQQMQNIATAGGVANLAGGGIAKLAGVDQGPPPERGPNSQGLQGLMKRVRNL